MIRRETQTKLCQYDFYSKDWTLMKKKTCQQDFLLQFDKQNLSKSYSSLVTLDKTKLRNSFFFSFDIFYIRQMFDFWRGLFRHRKNLACWFFFVMESLRIYAWSWLCKTRFSVYTNIHLHACAVSQRTISCWAGFLRQFSCLRACRTSCGEKMSFNHMIREKM